MAKYHTYEWYLSLPQISQICTDTLVASNGLIHINSHSKENLWKSVLSVGKFNIQHLTFNIIKNGFTKLHQAGVSPALFSGFRPGRGKSPSDEMDSKMHPALWAVAEEWIQQEQQGVQSPASILYFLPFGRTLIFISDNRWVSWSNIEYRWVGNEKCCIFALWFRKKNINH
mgnify:CR=1 FL=1